MNDVAPVVAFRGISKRFGAIVACDHVDLELHPGEIHGILGQNGAGKSTLMKIFIGLVLPDEGEILVRGEQRRIHDPAAALALGIGMVHQHFSLVDALRVWENVALGDRGKLTPRESKALVRSIGERYGLEVDPDAVAGDLSAGLRQRVEIIKCLRRDPSIVIFDEPTSVLTPAESRSLFDTVRAIVKEEGRTVALISHKLDEVLHATDRVTIMRSGRVVETTRTADATAASLARGMVGRDVSLRSESAAAALGALELEVAELSAEEADDDPAETVPGYTPPGLPVVLRIDGARATARDGRVLLDDLTLEVRQGEIVGVAGVEGNGQVALGDLLSSLLRPDAGRITVDGRAVPAGRAGAMAAAGVGVIPEDRHTSGCVLDMSVAENLVLDAPERVAQYGVLSHRRIADFARDLVRDFEIVCASLDAPLWSLSGGNQQRVVLARELSRHPKVLVAAQPTRGLDVGAIEYMGSRLKEVAAAGVGVLLISSELEEILALSDRIVVMYRGRIIGEMARHEVDLDRLGLLMGGAAA